MPKKHTGVSKRKNGAWMAQAELGRDPVTGKRKRLTRYGKTAAEAKAKLDEAKAAIRSGTYIEDESLTLGQWLEHWLKNYVDNNVKHSTYVEYKRFVEKRYIPHLGKVRLVDLKTDLLQSFYNDLYHFGNLKEGGPLSAKTVRNIYLALHAALRQAVVNRLLIYNPCDGVVLPRVEETEMRVLNVMEQYQVLETLKTSDERYALGVLIALKTGMRIGEICGLRWCDIDLGRGQFYVRQTLQRRMRKEPVEGQSATEIIIGPPKSKKSKRVIPIPKQLIPFLARQKRAQQEDAEVAGELYEDKGYVLMNELGCYIEPPLLRTPLAAFRRLRISPTPISTHCATPLQRGRWRMGWM